MPLRRHFNNRLLAREIAEHVAAGGITDNLDIDELAHGIGRSLIAAGIDRKELTAELSQFVRTNVQETLAKNRQPVFISIFTNPLKSTAVWLAGKLVEHLVGKYTA